MYVYDPVPAAPVRVETGEARIASIRAEQNNTQHIADIRAGLPERISNRVIGIEQVQRELAQQTEEELQQTLEGVNRAANPRDPELTGDAVIIARYLVKNNLLGGLARSVEALTKHCR